MRSLLHLRANWQIMPLMGTKVKLEKKTSLFTGLEPHLTMPILDPHTLEFFSRSPEQTRRVGMRLGAILKTGDVVGLVGDLGSGKTTFVQGIAAGWGSLDQVSSPTFVLINQYRRPIDGLLFHLDAYRLANAIQAEELDLEPMLGQGPLLVEWADHIDGALPAERLWITMRWMAEEQRGMRISGQGKRYEKLVANLRQIVFGVA
jgi:tRNA threonylcarbamoyladenosine biosynthesis protein TsaE